MPRKKIGSYLAFNPDEVLGHNSTGVSIVRTAEGWLSPFRDTMACRFELNNQAIYSTE